MSEGPKRRGTGATFADVWPAAPQAPRGTQETSEASLPHLSTTEGGARSSDAALPARQSATKRIIARRDQRISTETIEGKLLGHGWARHRFQPTEALSYYARLLTPGGVVNLWGRGLAQAIAKSTTQVGVGDRVGFRRLEQDTRTGRVHWRAEKPEWFAAHDKAASRRRDEQLAALRAAQEDPELARAMLQMKAAEALAERRLSDPKQRLQFITGVAARLKQTVQQTPSRPVTPPRAQPQERAASDAPRPRKDRDSDRTR